MANDVERETVTSPCGFETSLVLLVSSQHVFESSLPARWLPRIERAARFRTHLLQVQRPTHLCPSYFTHGLAQ